MSSSRSFQSWGAHDIMISISSIYSRFYCWILKFQTQITVFKRNILHSLSQSKHSRAISNQTDHKHVTHSALFLPPDVEQMSKRANDSWARRLLDPLSVCDTDWPFQIHLAKPPKTKDLEFTKRTISNETMCTHSNSFCMVNKKLNNGCFYMLKSSSNETVSHHRVQVQIRATVSLSRAFGSDCFYAASAFPLFSDAVSVVVKDTLYTWILFAKAPNTVHWQLDKNKLEEERSGEDRRVE